MVPTPVAASHRIAPTYRACVRVCVRATCARTHGEGGVGWQTDNGGSEKQWSGVGEVAAAAAAASTP